MAEHADKQLLILEGQINLKFIEEICAKNNFKNYRIILIHTDDAIRHERLPINRNQPELVNVDMDNWAAFLKRQAMEMDVPILDSGKLDMDQIVFEIQRLKNIYV